MRKVLLILLIGQVLAYGAEVLSLEDCLNLARQKNPDLRIGEKQIQSAQEGIRASYSGILPEIGISSKAVHSSQGANEMVYGDTTIPTSEKSRNDFNAGFYYQQNLYDGGKWWNAIKLARTSLSVAQLEVAEVSQQIIANVTEKFYTVLKAQELLKVYEMTLKNSQEQLKKTEEMFRIGQVAKKDLFKSQVREGNDRLAVIKQKAEVEVTLSDLKVAIGVTAEFGLEIQEEIYQKPALIDFTSARTLALANNPQLKILSQQKQNSDLNYKITRSDLYPTVSAIYKYDRGGSELARVVNVNEFDRWWGSSLTLNVSMPLFQGFSRKAKIQQGLLDFRQYDDKIAKQEIEIINQVENLVRTINTYSEMLGVNELNILSAQEDLRLAQEMYRLNSATILDVLDAQVALTRAQSDLVTTKYDAKIYEAKLAYLMGILK